MDDQIPDIKEDLPDDSNYSSQKGNNNVISPQAWWTGDGCLPGGYQHCGANCGYAPREHGGGEPINETDRCCVLHDDCYASGAKNCSCDTMLKECTALHATWAAAGIQIYFKGC